MTNADFVISKLTVLLFLTAFIRNYLTSWFLIDLLGTFPFEKIIQGEASSRKSLKLIKYFKIPKLMRISRVMKYVRDHKYVYDIFQVFILVFTFLHIGACLWMLVLQPCKEGGDAYAGSEICAQDNTYSLYAESFHLSAAMMLGISNFHILGDSSALDLLTERREEDRIHMYVISTLFMVGGLFLVALLMSEMNVYLMGKMQGSAAFQRKIDRVKHEMEYYAVPNDLQLKVKAFYDYVWIHQKQYDENVALLTDKQMSTDLQRKLALHLFKDVVSQVSIFSEVDDLLLGEICLSLQTKIFLPRDMIVLKGDVGKELFIIAKGVVEVLRDDLPTSHREKAAPIFLKNGSCFGEIALVMEVRRTCSVQAQTICEINILKQQAFDSILRENTDFARRMNELVVARQLETSMTKSKGKGVNFRVSKVDLDRAVNAVELNMKEGLERRMKQNKSSRNQLDHSCHSANVVSTALSQDFPYDDKNESDNSNHEFPSKTCIHTHLSNVNNTFSNQNKNACHVSKIIEDIARRSTRFQENNEARHHQGFQEKSKESFNTNSRDCEETDDFYSDSELAISRKERAKVGWKRLRRKRDGRHLSSRISDSVKDIDDEDEQMRVTGHFNPNRSVVDINKVHPSILKNGGIDQYNPSKDFLLSLDAQLCVQDRMIRTILAKLQNLENHQLNKDE